MNYSLNIGEWNSVFAVPSSLVDKYIKLSSGNSLKLMLFLLRHGGEAFTPDRLRAELGFAEPGELEDAAQFWVQRGIIRYCSEDEGKLAAAREEISAPEQEVPKQVEIAVLPNLKPEAKPKPISVSSGEIASRIREDSNIKTLFEEAEKLYGRALRQSENQMLISLADYYELPVGVSLMLLQFCSKINKLSPSYITAVAADWAENGIITIEKADAKIHSLEQQNGIEARLRESLELTAGFTPAQKKQIAVWLEDWKFSEEMILLSLNKTIEQIGKLNFKYANKILETWRAEGITTAEQTKVPSSARKQSETNSSFDMGNVMANIMKRYKG